MAETIKFSELNTLPEYDANKVIAIQNDPAGATKGWKGHITKIINPSAPSDALLVTEKGIKDYAGVALDKVDIFTVPNPVVNTYALSFTPKSYDSISIIYNGVTYIELGIDYDVSDSSFTWLRTDIPLVSGELIFVKYRY